MIEAGFAPVGWRAPVETLTNLTSGSAAVREAHAGDRRDDGGYSR